MKRPVSKQLDDMGCKGKKCAKDTENVKHKKNAVKTKQENVKRKQNAMKDEENVKRKQNAKGKTLHETQGKAKGNKLDDEPGDESTATPKKQVLRRPAASQVGSACFMSH